MHPSGWHVGVALASSSCMYGIPSLCPFYMCTWQEFFRIQKSNTLRVILHWSWPCSLPTASHILVVPFQCVNIHQLAPVWLLHILDLWFSWWYLFLCIYLPCLMDGMCIWAQDKLPHIYVVFTPWITRTCLCQGLWPLLLEKCCYLRHCERVLSTLVSIWLVGLAGCRGGVIIIVWLIEKPCCYFVLSIRLHSESWPQTIYYDTPLIHWW